MSSSNVTSSYKLRPKASGGVSNICSNKTVQYGPTFSPRTMQRNLQAQLNLQKRRQRIDHANMFNKEEVATQLAVSKSTVNRLIRDGELRAIKIGKSVRVMEQDLFAFISNRPSA